MEIMKTEFYSYQELLNVFPSRAPTNPNQTGLDAEWFTKLLGDLSIQYKKYAVDSSFTDIDVKGIVNSVMTNVYDRHADDILFSVTSSVCEEDHTLTQADVRKALSKLVNVLNLTLPKYLVLLKQFKKSSSDPIAPIKSSSIGKTRFNDTPQSSGTYDDVDHTTNVSDSSSETTVDTGSLMERLSAIFKDWKSIVLEWSNEFNQCFLKEEQIYE